VGEREELTEHRPGVPVDVAEAALGVTPRCPPGDAGHDHSRREVVAERRRRDADERVRNRVVPIDAVLEALHAVCGHVDLQWEPAARRAGRPESPDAGG